MQRRSSDRQNLAVEGGVEEALAAVEEARARRTALETAVEQAAEVARIEALALEVGSGVQTDFLRAASATLSGQSRPGTGSTRRSDGQRSTSPGYRGADLGLASGKHGGNPMKRGVQTLAFATPLVLATLGGTLFLTGCEEGETGEIQASGTVEATDADLGFQMAGRIEAILVREGDSVRADQEVAFLDQEELLARRRSAEAQKDAASCGLERDGCRIPPGRDRRGEGGPAASRRAARRCAS